MPRQTLYSYKRDSILAAIKTLTDANHGKPPSLREIATIADISVATVHSYLLRMKEEGVVEWAFHRHRNLRVVE